jgi:hypothetical protein
VNVTLDKHHSVVRVTLSRRNLQTLLLKLDEPSERTLIRNCDGVMLYVMGENDEAHYGDRTPGMVHPREEAKLAEPSCLQELLEDV